MRHRWSLCDITKRQKINATPFLIGNIYYTYIPWELSDIYIFGRVFLIFPCKSKVEAIKNGNDKCDIANIRICKKNNISYIFWQNSLSNLSFKEYYTQTIYALIPLLGQFYQLTKTLIEPNTKFNWLHIARSKFFFFRWDDTFSLIAKAENRVINRIIKWW